MLSTCEFLVQNYTERIMKHKKMKHFKTYRSKETLKHLTSYMMMCEVWIIRKSHKCAALERIQLIICSLTDHTETKLTSCSNDVKVVNPQFHQRKWRVRSKWFCKLSINTKHEINLPSLWRWFRLGWCTISSMCSRKEWFSSQVQ